MDNNYTWVKTHKGIVQYLSDKENSQQELIDLLKSVGITPFNDKSKEGEHDIELKEIDPFTFFCYIHKYGAKRALGFLKQIAELLGLEKPTTVNGIPSAQPQRVWLFPPEYMRVNNEVPRLWNLFKKELKGDVDNDTFADVLNIKNVGRAKLTEALFYINPEKYLPINGPTRPYIKKELGIDVGFTTYSEYIELLEKIRAKTDMPFYELSHEAWVWNIDKTKENYWVFQGNPDKYDFEAAFKEDDIDAWTVTSHKASIKEGDKVIIWITGNKAGCYALADVVSDPMDRESFADSDLWKEEDTSELKAAINITHNLASNPILKDEIDKIKDLDNLKVGSQGTNFSATKQEYETLLELAVKREDSMNYREGYINWLRNKYGDRSGTISAYEKAIDILSKILSVEIFEISDIKYLDDLYKDLIKEQRNEKGRYYHPDAPSYGNNGFYSASIMSYMEFLVSKQKPVKQSKEKMITPSNTILYGPPGTGKTYNTINEALKIIDNKFFEENIDNRQALNKRFRELRFNPSTGEGQIAFITFHQSLSYEDFIEGIKPVKYEGEENVRYEVCSGLFKSIANNANNDRIEHEEDNANKPYVIIIDEINRGNISQIFGELITLIEPDKRKGQAEEIEVILPYSKERFSVPSNLHIIGTMNTADRSVEALDTALRRRFSFVEMNPVPGLLSKDEFGCKGVDLEAMLRAINGRIEKLLDRDYCIGHSYFMTIKDKQEPLEELKYIFQNKILPLLQEYFYGDWGKIRLIVGKEFVDRRKSDVDFLDEEGEEDIEEFEDRTIYSFTDCEGWTLDSFRSIYEEK